MESLIVDFDSKLTLDSDLITIFRKKRNDKRSARRRAAEENVSSDEDTEEEKNLEVTPE